MLQHTLTFQTTLCFQLCGNSLGKALSCFSSTMLQKWFVELDSPAQSPDLNSIEHFWYELLEQVCSQTFGHVVYNPILYVMNLNTPHTHTHTQGLVCVLYSDPNKLWCGAAGLSLSQVNDVINERVWERIGAGALAFKHLSSSLGLGRPSWTQPGDRSEVRGTIMLRAAPIIAWLTMPAAAWAGAETRAGAKPGLGLRLGPDVRVSYSGLCGWYVKNCWSWTVFMCFKNHSMTVSTG